MLVFPSSIGFFGDTTASGGASNVTVELGDSYTGSASSNTLTVSNVDLGTAATDRVSVIGVAVNDGGEIPLKVEIKNSSSAFVQCGVIIETGTSSSFHGGGPFAAATGHACGLYSLPTGSATFGTTGDVKVTFEGNPRLAIVSYALYNTNAGHIDKFFHNASTASMPQDIPAGGAVIGLCAGGESQTGTWAGDSVALTEDKDNIAGSGPVDPFLYSASNTYSEQSLAHDITFTPASAHTDFARTVVTFAPNTRISRVLTDRRSSGSDASSYTFSDCMLGTGKIIVAGLTGNETKDITGITVDGNTATELTSNEQGGTYMAMYQYNGNTAATGDIVVSMSGTAGRCGILVYLVNNAADSATATANSTSNAQTTIDVPEGGLLIAVGHFGNGTTPTSTTGVDPDAVVGTEAVYYGGSNPEQLLSGASRWYPSASSGGAVEFSTTQDQAISAVSFAESA